MPLLIDGHNLIGQIPSLSLVDPDDEAKLLQLLARYHWRKKQPITVVFDPGLLPAHVSRSRPPAGITVVYAPAGSDADKVLLDRIAHHAKPKTLTVISSDRSIAAAAKAAGATVIRAQDFARELIRPPEKVETEPEDRPLSREEVQEWLDLFSHSPPE